MKMIIKKILSAALALVMICGALSSFAFAENEIRYTLSIPASGGKVEVKVDGEVKHNGGGGCFINVPAGADVTVTATAKTGEFMYWTDGASRLVWRNRRNENNLPKRQHDRAGAWRRDLYCPRALQQPSR